MFRHIYQKTFRWVTQRIVILKYLPLIFRRQHRPPDVLSCLVVSGGEFWKSWCFIIQLFFNQKHENLIRFAISLCWKHFQTSKQHTSYEQKSLSPFCATLYTMRSGDNIVAELDRELQQAVGVRLTDGRMALGTVWCLIKTFWVRFHMFYSFFLKTVKTYLMILVFQLFVCTNKFPSVPWLSE